jgi:ferredoxin-NADP reductase
VLRSEAARPRPMALIYSNRQPEDAAYLEELRALGRRLDNFRLIVTMTGTTEGDASIDVEMVREAASGLPRPHYYIARTPDMCEDMRQIVDDMGIDDQDIHSEDFTGYT